jgi:hypothetical protein
VRRFISQKGYHWYPSDGNLAMTLRVALRSRVGRGHLPVRSSISFYELHRSYPRMVEVTYPAIYNSPSASPLDLGHVTARVIFDSRHRHLSRSRRVQSRTLTFSLSFLSPHLAFSPPNPQSMALPHHTIPLSFRPCTFKTFQDPTETPPRHETYLPESPPLSSPLRGYSPPPGMSYLRDPIAGLMLGV